MNIVVVGAGGVGGYFGGRLAEAGKNITFLLRGKTLEAIKNNGLVVNSIHGDFKVHPNATDKMEELGEPDLIILAVKSWQVKDIVSSLKSIISKTTVILPLQNGANNFEKISEIIPQENIVAGFCKVVSKIESPGVIKHMGAEPEIVIGENDNRKSDRIQKLQEFLNSAKFKCSIAENIQLEIWKKFLFICTISGLGGLTRVSLGQMREDSYLRNVMEKTADEIIAVANKLGVGLGDDHKELVFHFIDKLDYNTTASMQRDIMAGRPSELDDFNGYIVAQGEKLQIKTPINSFIYHSLLSMEKVARKQN
ncbi:ketopantoate reductase [Flavobacteriaceae bacterium MAR_2010_188]|nr:ketopantoate reductase [Flavobacteriaceae bacterium MAR_2010_188]